MEDAGHPAHHAEFQLEDRILKYLIIQKEFTHVYRDPIMFEDYFINNTSKDVSIGCYNVDNDQLIELLPIASFHQQKPRKQEIRRKENTTNGL